MQKALFVTNQDSLDDLNKHLSEGWRVIFVAGTGAGVSGTRYAFLHGGYLAILEKP